MKTVYETKVKAKARRKEVRVRLGGKTGEAYILTRKSAKKLAASINKALGISVGSKAEPAVNPEGTQHQVVAWRVISVDGFPETTWIDGAPSAEQVQYEQSNGKKVEVLYGKGVLPEGLVTKQYYWQTTECQATSQQEKCCICWYDQGTGPMGELSQKSPNLFTWREKIEESKDEPAETPVQDKTWGGVPIKEIWFRAASWRDTTKPDSPTMWGIQVRMPGKSRYVNVAVNGEMAPYRTRLSARYAVQSLVRNEDMSAVSFVENTPIHLTLQSVVGVIGC